MNRRLRSHRFLTGALAILLPLIALAATAAPAVADDASLAQAYASQDAALTRHVEQVRKGERTWVRSDLRRSGPFLRALKLVRGDLRKVRIAVRREEASTRTGRQAKTQGLRAITGLDRAYRQLISAVMASDAGDRAKGERQARRAIASARRALRANERASALFKKLAEGGGG